jgi:mRNA deadenylase 3'-5' endonuclease subunit Ccr4
VRLVETASVSKSNGGSQNDAATATTTTTAHHAASSSSSSSVSSSFCTVISWNILAEQYCNKRSQNHLPERAQSQIFDPKRRRRHWQRTLTALLGGDDHHDGNNDHNKVVDVVCLQEVDRLVEDIAPCLSALGYQNYAASPTVNGGGAGGKVDAVAIFIRNDIWSIVEEKLVRFDDLATMMQHQQQPCSGRQGEEDATTTHDSSSDGANGVGIDNDNDDDGSPTERRRQQDAARKTTGKTTTKAKQTYGSSSSPQRHLPGLSYSFLRRNVALLVRLRHQVTGRTVVVANAHLYWNPSYEYVKVRRM